MARLLAALLVGTCGWAAAQVTTPPQRVRGVISAVKPDALVVHTRDGQDLAVGLASATVVRAISLARIADLRPGSYIGSAAQPQPDGTLKAIEVHVFPPAMAGTGEGHRPWDSAPGGTMTNGTVGDVVAAQGHTLTVRYQGGEQKIIVPDDVPVVNIEPGDRTLLRVGTQVVLFATRGDDGALTATSISAGKDGITPPM